MVELFLEAKSIDFLQLLVSLYAIGNIFEKPEVKSRLELIDEHYRFIFKEIKDILLVLIREK